MAEKGYEGLNLTLVQNLKRKIGELKESEEKYRTLIETTNTGFVILDGTGKVVDANQEYVRLSGYKTLADILGRSVVEWTAEYEKERNAKEVGKCFKQGFVKNLEIDYIDQRGRITPIEVNATVVKTKDGPLIMTLCRDITERRKAEQMLKESEEKFRAVFECSNDGILAADTKTKRFVFANPRICRLTGYSAEELLKLSLADIHPKKDLAYVVGCFMKQAQGKLEVAKDLPVLRKDRKVVYCDINAASAKIGGRDFLVGFFRDITDRRNTEEALREKLKEIDILGKRCREQKACRR